MSLSRRPCRARKKESKGLLFSRAQQAALQAEVVVCTSGAVVGSGSLVRPLRSPGSRGRPQPREGPGVEAASP